MATEYTASDVLDAVTSDGLTPLHLAAAKGHADAIALLLAFGADADVLTPDGLSAAHLAAREGHVDACRVLFNHKNAVTRHGPSALMLAVKHRQYKVVLNVLIPAGVPFTTPHSLQSASAYDHVLVELEWISNTLSEFGSTQRFPRAVAALAVAYVLGVVWAAFTLVHELSFASIWACTKVVATVAVALCAALNWTVGVPLGERLRDLAASELGVTTHQVASRTAKVSREAAEAMVKSIHGVVASFYILWATTTFRCDAQPILAMLRDLAALSAQVPAAPTPFMAAANQHAGALPKTPTKGESFAALSDRIYRTIQRKSVVELLRAAESSDVRPDQARPDDDEDMPTITEHATMLWRAFRSHIVLRFGSTALFFTLNHLALTSFDAPDQTSVGQTLSLPILFGASVLKLWSVWVIVAEIAVALEWAGRRRQEFHIDESDSKMASFWAFLFHAASHATMAALSLAIAVRTQRRVPLGRLPFVATLTSCSPGLYLGTWEGGTAYWVGTPMVLWPMLMATGAAVMVPAIWVYYQCPAKEWWLRQFDTEETNLAIAAIVVYVWLAWLIWYIAWVLICAVGPENSQARTQRRHRFFRRKRLLVAQQLVQGATPTES